MDYKDLSGHMPLQHITEALDDTGDGMVDAKVWAQVQETAENRINDAFGGSVPDQYTDDVSYPREVFIVELLYGRRGFDTDRNPYEKKASDAEKRLRDLASGETNTEGNSAGVVISKPAKVAQVTRLIV